MPFQDPNDKTGFLGGSMGSNPGQHTFMDLGVQLGGREMYQPSSQGLLNSMSQPRVDYHQQFDGRQTVDYGQQGGYGGFSPLNTSQGLLSNLQQQQSRNSQAAIIAFLQGSGNAHITPDAQSIGSNEQCIFPSSLMTTLNLLQKNIATLQALIPLLNQTGTSTQQQEAATVGVANVLQASMAQLASAAAGLLPQAQQASRDRVNPRGMADDTHLTNPHADGCSFGLSQETNGRGGSLNTVGELVQQMSDKEEDDQAGFNLAREDDNEESEENLPEGSYDVMELDAMEILAEHTHFCEICNKGFKRDANLRMHMRGHGDQYKTAAALAKPDKPPEPANLRPKRFSCPYVGCKRNRKHPKFQPLKTMLCVKNHYRRSHCPKVLSCSKCGAKKFSVVADLKTHEKHCGREKWMCSCKTTFSRKDKLLGHLNLFKGHTPVLPSPTKKEEEQMGGSAAPPSSQAAATSLAVAEALGLDLRRHAEDQSRLAGTFDTPNLLSSFYASNESPLGGLDGQENMGLSFHLKEETQSAGYWDRRGSSDAKQ